MRAVSAGCLSREAGETSERMTAESLRVAFDAENRVFGGPRDQRADARDSATVRARERLSASCSVDYRTSPGQVPG